MPAQLLPLKVFEAEAPIIPTGIKTYPATYPEGILTLTNGSVLSETLPSGVVFSASNGVEVQTTEFVFIPPGSASGYGVARVAARALLAGSNGNIQTLAVNAVYGTALYVRNLSPFTGGQDGYSVTFATAHDKQLAVTAARTLLAPQIPFGYHYPCQERYVSGAAKVTLTWDCQFATYHVPAYMHVQAVRLIGKNFLVDVTFVPRPHQIWVK